MYDELGLLTRSAQRGLLDLTDALARPKRTNFHYRQELFDEVLKKYGERQWLRPLSRQPASGSAAWVRVASAIEIVRGEARAPCPSLPRRWKSATAGAGPREKKIDPSAGRATAGDLLLVRNSQEMAAFRLALARR